MLSRSLVLFVALASAACSSGNSTPTPRVPPPAPAPATPPPSRPPESPPAAPRPNVVRPLPAHGQALPTTIRLVNQSGEPIQFDSTWGQMGFLFASSPDGDLGPVTLDASDHFCDCVCAPAGSRGGRCAECERPRETRITVPARATRELAWNGRLRRAESSPSQGRCEAVFDPAPGPFIVGACTADAGRCAVAQLELPSTGPIELAFSASPPRPLSCPLDPARADRAFRIAAFTMDLGFVVPERRESCRMDASRCVMPEAIALAREGERRSPCATFLVPHRDGLEVETFLPLPPGTNGGERYSVFFDPTTLHVVRARYEQ